MKTVGIDPGLRHGAVALWTEERERPYEILFSWKEKDLFSLSSKINFNKMRELTKMIMDSLIQQPGYSNWPVGIDYDQDSIFWRKTNKAAGVSLAFFLGYLTRALQTLGHPVVLLSSKKVRSLLRLNRTAKKEEVHQRFKQGTDFSMKKIDEDALDAVILARVLWEELHRGRQDGTASLPGLPSQGTDSSPDSEVDPFS